MPIETTREPLLQVKVKHALREKARWVEADPSLMSPGLDLTAHLIVPHLSRCRYRSNERFLEQRGNHSGTPSRAALGRGFDGKPGRLQKRRPPIRGYLRKRIEHPARRLDPHIDEVIH